MNAPVRYRITLENLARYPKIWVELLWNAMRVSGRGYRHHTLKRRPPAGASRWRGERRPDKVERARFEAANPVFTGKINFRRSKRPA